MTKSTAPGWLTAVLICGVSLSLSAARPDHIRGEVLVQLRQNAGIRELISDINASSAGRAASFRIRKELAGPLNIWRCAFNPAAIDEQVLLEQLRRHPLVVRAQFNHLLDLRGTVPDDPQLSKQWQYINTGQNGGTPGMDLDMELVWDVTTGGLTAGGDTIVVCVIDNGFDIRHEDLAGALWINRAEIPGNGIDDDLNGFTDDYRGWNTVLNNDNVTDEERLHGTAVAGIIGARGNNGTGISGVNWNVRLMLVEGGIGVESEALEAFGYPLAQRRRYNETNGREGAFVVATNASWGVNFGNPDDYPLWCAVYDELGAAGILNVCSTINKGINVDQEGDMPTTCSSDFLISVTNLNNRGQKVGEAGFGAVNIDLGAFGEGVFTLGRNNQYGAFFGTSAAAPHVAGAIALLYAAPCPALTAVAERDPAGAARLVRQALLSGVRRDAVLSGLTASGGRLNILGALDFLLDNCAPCAPPTSLRATAVTDRSANLSWGVNDSILEVDLRWRELGAENWTSITAATSPFALAELSPCTEYEFQLRADCRGQALAYGPSIVFRTDGCCDTPAAFRLTGYSERSAAFQWQPVFAAEAYRLRIRGKGEMAYREFTTTRTFITFNNLDACTDYEVSVSTECAAGTTDFSAPVAFRTSGCGACLDKSYCIPEFIDSEAEWIAEVIFNTLENASGPDNGYGDYTGRLTTELIAGQSYPIRLRPGFSGAEQVEYFQVWIDLNQDGSFDSQELVFDPGGVSRSTVNGTVKIPAGAPLGPTRLRVAMRYFRPGGPCSFTVPAFGEIEDYCVTITDHAGAACQPPPDLTTQSVDDTRADLTWTITGAGSDYLLRYRPRNTGDWIQAPLVSGGTMRLEALDRCTEYEVQVKSVCSNTLGSFSPPLVFRTSCTTSAETAVAIEKFDLFPNPFRRQLTLHLLLNVPQQNLRFLLFDGGGRRLLLREQSLPAGEHLLEFPLPDLPAGVYWLQVVPANGAPVTRRVVKGRG